MIVNNLNIMRFCADPGKADPILVIDTDTVLPFTFALKSFQMVSWRYFQVSQTRSDLKLTQLSSGYRLKRLKVFHAVSARKRPRIFISKGSYHASIITPYNNNVKRYYIKRQF